MTEQEKKQGERTLLEKLNALRVLGSRYLRLNQGDLKDTFPLTEQSFAEIWVLTDRLLTPGLPFFQAYAVTLLLDFSYPWWRVLLPEGFFGFPLKRDDPSMHIWRGDVLQRDCFLCQDCGSSQALHAHHLVPWAVAPMLRAYSKNGLTVCRSCHKQRHVIVERGTDVA